MNTKDCGPNFDGLERLRNVERVGKAELTRPVLHQIKEVPTILGSREVDAHAGMEATEPADQFGHRVGRKRGQAAHAEGARQNPGDGGHCGPTHFDVPHCLAGGTEECDPGRGQLDSPANPGEQRGKKDL